MKAGFSLPNFLCDHCISKTSPINGPVTDKDAKDELDSFSSSRRSVGTRNLFFFSSYLLQTGYRIHYDQQPR